jgi:alpha-beta hydrolase superfamily lysophospholipase
MVSAPSRALDRIGLRLYRRFVFRPSARPWTWPEGAGEPAAWEPARFSRSDGHAVVGLWGPAVGEARATIVCAHPFKRSGKGFFLKHGHAGALRRSGYHVLLLDFGGFGETPPQSVLFPRDVLAAGEEAARRAPDLPVGFLGVCFGAVYGTCAFSTRGHPFRAAVLDAPYANATASLRAMTGHVPRPRFHQVQKAVVRLTRPLFPALDPLRHAARAGGLRGVLMIAGGADIFSPEGGVRQYVPAFRRAGVPCDLWTVPDAEHLDAFKTASEAYTARVVDFFDRHLSGLAERPASTDRDRPLARRRWARRGYGRRMVGASGSGR